MLAADDTAPPVAPTTPDTAVLLAPAAPAAAAPAADAAVPSVNDISIPTNSHLVRTDENPLEIIEGVLKTNDTTLHRSLASNTTVINSSDSEMKKKFYHLIITYPQIDPIAKETAIDKARGLYPGQSRVNKSPEQWYTPQVKKTPFTSDQLLIQIKINLVFGTQTFSIPSELSGLQSPPDTTIVIPKITLPGYLSKSVELIAKDETKVIFTIPTQIEKYSTDESKNIITISDITLVLRDELNNYLTNLENISFKISEYQLDIFETESLLSTWTRKS